MKTGSISLFFLYITFSLFSQGLENVTPILANIKGCCIKTDQSFLLTPNMFSIEIIDASQPWPPRWYALANQVNDESSGNKMPATDDAMFSDARYQAGKFTFCKLTGRQGENKGLYYITCNEKMVPLDSFSGKGLPLNFHDFKLNKNGEKLVLARLDTVLNLTVYTGTEADSNAKVMIDIIEVFDKHDSLIFRWNPVYELGTGAIYPAYARILSLSSRPGFIDWSHANGVSWDFDGNILYSFRHIGVGKIDRGSGKVIWRIDRNKMPYTAGAQSLAFYLQHAFQEVKHTKRYTTYYLYSDGDSAHRDSYGIEFNIDNQTLSIQNVKKKIPSVQVRAIRSGNYDLDKKGYYVMNYGEHRDNGDTLKENAFFESGNGSMVCAQYGAGEQVYSYTVHVVGKERPSRPGIFLKKDGLHARGKMNEWIWYQLSGAGNARAKKVGEGAWFKPENPGLYCVAGKYGMGWAVSLPFNSKF